MTSRTLFTSPPQVLDLSSERDGKLVTLNAQVVFLDEFRIAIIPDGFGMTELTVFNTLIAQDRPGNLRQLVLPGQFLDRTARIRVDHDRPLGARNGGGPLIADPVQGVLIVELGGLRPPVFLVARTQALIEQIGSTRADSGSRIPWNEWGRGAVVMEVQTPGGYPCTFVLGTQVVVVKVYDAGGRDRRHNVQTFDLSWRGCGPLPAWFESRTEKRALVKDEGCPMFGLGGGAGWSDKLGLLSDGSLFYLVSCLSRSAGSEAVG